MTMETRTNTTTEAQRSLQSAIDLLEAKAELALLRLTDHPSSKFLRGRYNEASRDLAFTKQRLATAMTLGI